MITTDKAQVVAEEIRKAVAGLNHLVAEAAEVGVKAEFTVGRDRIQQYPAEYIDIARIDLDLGWLSPEEIEAEIGALDDDD